MSLTTRAQNISRLLVANRGEIACRIFRTAKALGIQTIAVYSDADKHALHRQQADESYCIGPAAAHASYLNVDAIVKAAIDSRADAVHPGYGFLSENPALPRALAKAGITFVGPSPSAIEIMGDKRQAKLAAIKAGLPTLPGFHQEDASDQVLRREAEAIGYPLMVKAAHGGGGRGMRLVEQAADLAAALQSARAESRNAFGSEALMLEKALLQPRHIEVQVFADQQGNAVYLGDRDCSVQRRHQKVVEEAPAANLNEALKARMGQAAVKLALACNYEGAGTVEFLVDGDEFYFLEMNTRLQVEHPVTEAVYQEDLVAWQLAVAQGQPLPKHQQQLAPSGHAIEVRLYAEDPQKNFLPQSGTLFHWRPFELSSQPVAKPFEPPAPHSGSSLPAISRHRTDHMLFNGVTVGNWYDPMLAKLVAWGPTRAAAINGLLHHIHGTLALGLNHNLGFLARICAHPDFQSAPPSTQFLSQHALEKAEAKHLRRAQLAAATANFLASRPTMATAGHWYNNLSRLSQPTERNWRYGDIQWQATTNARYFAQGILRVSINHEETNEIANIEYRGTALSFELNGEKVHTHIFKHNEKFYVQYLGEHFSFETPSLLAKNDTSASTGILNAPMDGQLLAMVCEDGQRVKAGDTLLIIEAMKMEMPLKAAVDGRVELACKLGEQVSKGQVLAKILQTDRNEKPNDAHLNTPQERSTHEVNHVNAR